MSSKNNFHNEAPMMDNMAKKAHKMAQSAECNLEEFGEDLVEGTHKMADQVEDAAASLAHGMTKGAKKMVKQANKTAHKTTTKIGEAIDDM